MILTIDEGTTNTKVAVFDDDFNLKMMEKKKIKSYFPRAGWHEQDPEEIFSETRKLMVGMFKENVKSIGITNQRETTILWSAESGKPIYNAIVWQCRRTSEIIENLRSYEDLIKKKTGLNMDAYFSASKIKWLLDNIPNGYEKVKSEKLKFGTVDSYLIWKLTGGIHATDVTNASRTMLFNIKHKEWDDEILEIFKIPSEILPEVRDSNAYFGDVRIRGTNVPITGVIGDQQASLFGHRCFKEGDMKITYGTGAFILANIGRKIKIDKNILTTIAWGIDDKVDYALEGSIFSAGTVVEWLKNLKIWNENNLNDIESELYLVPAFSGLGAPYWDQFARGLLIGITQDVDSRHITKAALESIGYMVRDVVEIMKNYTSIGEIKVDGGMTKNEYLMQFQSDILQTGIVVPEMQEITSLGAAMMSAIGTGIKDMKDLQDISILEIRYIPKKDKIWRDKKYEIWKKAVVKSLRWGKNFH